jgi:hypothetical protein
MLTSAREMKKSRASQHAHTLDSIDFELGLSKAQIQIRFLQNRHITERDDNCTNSKAR